MPNKSCRHNSEPYFRHTAVANYIVSYLGDFVPVASSYNLAEIAGPLCFLHSQFLAITNHHIVVIPFSISSIRSQHTLHFHGRLFLECIKDAVSFSTAASANCDLILHLSYGTMVIARLHHTIAGVRPSMTAGLVECTHLNALATSCVSAG